MKRLILLVWLIVASIAAAEPTIVFMTDFGVVDDSVAICKGVMLTIEPSLRIIDITHEVPAFSILDGARFLAGTAPYYPAGAVFVVVVDPGVGSTRKPIVAKSKQGQYFVLPNNGLLTLVQDQDGIEEAREITNTAWMVGGRLSSTFHGRDIFSPVGAHIAKGEDWSQTGPVVTDLVRLDVSAAKVETKGITGEVIALDGPYGNLITNISEEQFRQVIGEMGKNVEVWIGKRKLFLPYVRTFSDVPLKKPLLYVTSRGVIGLAINQGSFAAFYGIKPPVHVFIPSLISTD
jgi:hypothetical protein